MKKTKPLLMQISWWTDRMCMRMCKKDRSDIISATTPKETQNCRCRET